MIFHKDMLFRRRDSGAKPFAFNYKVALVFDDMAHRSIPLYRELLKNVARLALQFYLPGTAIVDVGCSTGGILIELNKEAKRLGAMNKLKWIGIDKSPDMCRKAALRARKYKTMIEAELMNLDADVANLPVASVVICLYTLQFISPDRRLGILEAFYRSLVPGGILILAEKTLPEHQENLGWIEHLYNDFKRDQQYSEAEIVGKRAALDGVLIPLTCRHYQSMLKTVGFVREEIFIKGFQFTAWMAFKPEDQD